MTVACRRTSETARHSLPNCRRSNLPKRMGCLMPSPKANQSNTAKTGAWALANYLKRGSDDSNGWRVRSFDAVSGALPYAVIENCLPVAQAAVSQSGSATVSQVYRIENHHHTKRGFDMWIVVLSARVEREEFERLRNSCQAANGWYSSKWGATPGGFAFKSESAASEWAQANCQGAAQPGLRTHSPRLWILTSGRPAGRNL